MAGVKEFFLSSPVKKQTFLINIHLANKLSKSWKAFHNYDPTLFWCGGYVEFETLQLECKDRKQFSRRNFSFRTVCKCAQLLMHILRGIAKKLQPM